MKEYAILCIYNGGKPFYLDRFYDISDVKVALYGMIDLEKKRNRAYYVDNDFFENQYTYNVHHCKYFCIQERDVTDWKKIRENKKKTNNIIYFSKSC